VGTVNGEMTKMVRQILNDHGISVAHNDTGGTQGRTLTYATATGQIKVRSLQPQKTG